MDRFKWRPPTKPFTRDYIFENENVKRKIKKSGTVQIREVLSEINRFELDRTFRFSIRKNRKIKTVQINKLVRENSYIKKKVKLATVGEFKKHLRIEGQTRIVGFTPDYVGYRRSKPVFCRNYLREKFTKNKELLSKYNLYETYMNVVLEPKDVWSGSYDSNGAHLSEFFRKRDVVKQMKAEEIIKIISGCPWFNMPMMEFTNPEEMYTDVNYNPKSNPGHYTSIITREGKKKFTINNAYALALEYYHEIISKPTKNFSLWQILAREKEIKINATKEPSTRVVMNPEHHVSLLLGWIFQKFMRLMNMGDPDCRYLIDGEFDGAKAKKLYERIISKFPLLVDADWTWFDASQDSEFLLAAVTVMMSNCPNDDLHKRLFCWVAHTTITKYVVVPPGFVIELKSGMPSGHNGVTAINCIVNLMRWAVIGYEIYGEGFWGMMELSVYGDDAIVGLQPHRKLFNIDRTLLDYGFLGDGIENRLFISENYLLEIHNAPDFLKRRISLEGVLWNRSKMFDRLIWQTKNRTIDEQILLLIEYVETGPYDHEFNSLVYEIIWKFKTENGDQLEQDTINKIDKFRIDYSRFNCFNSVNNLDGLEMEVDIMCNKGQIYLPNLSPINIDSMFFSNPEINNELKILYFATNNEEVYRKRFLAVKFFAFEYVFKKYFILKEGYLIPKPCFKIINNSNFILNSS